MPKPTTTSERRISTSYALPPSLCRNIERLSHAQQISRSKIVEMALAEYCAGHIDQIIDRDALKAELAAQP